MTPGLLGSHSHPRRRFSFLGTSGSQYRSKSFQGNLQFLYTVTTSVALGIFGIFAGQHPPTLAVMQVWKRH